MHQVNNVTHSTYSLLLALVTGMVFPLGFNSLSDIYPQTHKCLIDANYVSFHHKLPWLAAAAATTTTTTANAAAAATTTLI